jgi:arylsulfatase A-like enzyme
VKGSPYSEYNYTLNENGKLVEYGDKPEDYGTDVYARKSVDFIQRTAKEGKPFFIHLSVYAPHGPATPAPRHENLFLDAKAPRTPNFNEEDVSDKPAYIRNHPPLTSREISQIDEQYRRRLQSLQAVDDAIASLVDALKAVNQLDNTYIFFSSDNGFHLGNHRLVTGKIAPYEEDIRVPLIVRGPGVPTGRTIEHLAGNVDLAPTWAELAGAKVADFVDGRSLVPLLSNTLLPPESWRQAFLLENGPMSRQRSEARPSESLNVQEGVLEPEDSFPGRPQQRPRAVIPTYRGIRTRDYLYVEYATGERELYDMRRDPYQLQNLDATADPQVRAQLSAWLAVLSQCRGADCRNGERAPLGIGSTSRHLASGTRSGCWRDGRRERTTDADSRFISRPATKKNRR